MKTWQEWTDFVLRILTFVGAMIGGGWAIYQWNLSGSTDWTNNITLETKVLPYRGDTRLLVVHVRSTNPRNIQFELDKKLGDSFQIRFRRFPDGLKANAVVDEDSGDLIAQADLMQHTGDQYLFLPKAEMDDMRTLVVPVASVIVINAEMRIHNGTKDAHGNPESDFISASTVVHVTP